MKISNKFLMIGAATLALVAGIFTGCAESAGETGKIGKDIEITNSKLETASDKYCRGYQSLKTKHTSGSALITLPKASGTNANGDGVIGYIFGIRDSDKEDSNVKSFAVVGIRRNNENKVECYGSYFANVSVADDKINLYNTFADKNGVKIGDTDCLATEYKFIPEGSETYATLISDVGNDEDIVLRVDVVAQGTDTDKDGKVEAGEGDGNYKISIYKTAADGVTADGKALKEVTVQSPGDTTAKQYDLGLYTNVYPQCTLKGKLWLTDLVNEAGVVLE